MSCSGCTDVWYGFAMSFGACGAVIGPSGRHLCAARTSLGPTAPSVLVLLAPFSALHWHRMTMNDAAEGRK